LATTVMLGFLPSAIDTRTIGVRGFVAFGTATLGGNCSRLPGMVLRFRLLRKVKVRLSLRRKILTPIQ
jgi:hypothetical protein